MSSPGNDEWGLDVSWEWPQTGWFSCIADALYDPCEFECDLGTAVYSHGMLTMVCPVCAGTGIGKLHSC